MPVLRSLLYLALLVLVPTPSRADPALPVPLTAGVRVRVQVTAGDAPLVGRFEGADSLSLRVLPADASRSTEILRASALRLEASRGKYNHAAPGALLGWSLGLVSGVLIDRLTRERRDCPGCFHYDAYPGSTLKFACGGTLLGLLVGSSIRRERWEPAELPPGAAAP